MGSAHKWSADTLQETTTLFPADSSSSCAALSYPSFTYHDMYVSSRQTMGKFFFWYYAACSKSLPSIEWRISYMCLKHSVIQPEPTCIVAPMQCMAHNNAFQLAFSGEHIQQTNCEGTIKGSRIQQHILMCVRYKQPHMDAPNLSWRQEGLYLQACTPALQVIHKKRIYINIYVHMYYIISSLKIQIFS